MKKAIIFTVSLLILEISCLAQVNKEVLSPPQRIISLSPGITEMLYELGLGDKVVGVTDYCDFPEGVRDKFRVGGYLNTNYEAIVFVNPDLVMAPTEYSEEVKMLFENAEIDYMTVETQTTGDIFNAFKEIGLRCGVEEKAKEIVARMCRDIVNLRKKAAQKPDRRIMIVVGRDKGSFENLYIAGKNTFYDDLLSILGCENVYTKSDINYPALSLEAVMRLNPDVIIEMRPNYPDEEKSKSMAEWKSLKDVKAVKNNRVYILNGDYVCIPGPRFILILKDILEIL